jgi:hypothetical protein
MKWLAEWDLIFEAPENVNAAKKRGSFVPSPAKRRDTLFFPPRALHPASVTSLQGATARLNYIRSTVPCVWNDRGCCLKGIQDDPPFWSWDGNSPTQRGTSRRLRQPSGGIHPASTTAPWMGPCVPVLASVNPPNPLSHFPTAIGRMNNHEDRTLKRPSALCL